MKFTQRSIRWRTQLNRKKELIAILGGTVAATHSTAEVAMRQVMQKKEIAAPTLTAQGIDKTFFSDEERKLANRQGYERRMLARGARR